METPHNSKTPYKIELPYSAQMNLFTPEVLREAMAQASLAGRYDTVNAPAQFVISLIDYALDMER